MFCFFKKYNKRLCLLLASNKVVFFKNSILSWGLVLEYNIRTVVFFWHFWQAEGYWCWDSFQNLSNLYYSYRQTSILWLEQLLALHYLPLPLQIRPIRDALDSLTELVSTCLLFPMAPGVDLWKAVKLDTVVSPPTATASALPIPLSPGTLISASGTHPTLLQTTRRSCM